jgi:hypothetical protein
LGQGFDRLHRHYFWPCEAFSLADGIEVFAPGRLGV